mgnify:CR=1 FL=1
MDWYEETFRLTVVLVVGSAALVLSGRAGVGGSLPFAAGLVALAGLLFAATDQVGDGPRVLGHDLGRYAAVLWLGALAAAATVLLALDATPGEIQAVGGLMGLAGMLNYFLRPVYRIGARLLATAS